MADTTSALLAAMLGGGGGSRGSSDLDIFERDIAANDIFSQIAPAIGGVKFDDRTWSPGTKLGVSAGQAFLSGLLGGIGQNRQAEQLSKVAQVLPDLYSSPMGFQTPEGVDEGPFGRLRMNMVQDKLLRDAARADKTENFRTELFGDLLSKSKNPAAAINLFPKEAERLGLDSSQFQPSTPTKFDEALAKFGGDEVSAREYLKATDPDLFKATKAPELEKETYKRITDLPTYKLIADVDSNFKALLDLANQDSKAADIGLIATVSRIRDPNSTVREGEYAINADTQAYLDQKFGDWRSVITGKSRLPPDAKMGIIESVAPKYNELVKSYGSDKTRLIESLKNQGGNPLNVPAPDFTPFNGMKLLRSKKTGKYKIVPQ